MPFSSSLMTSCLLCCGLATGWLRAAEASDELDDGFIDAVLARVDDLSPTKRAHLAGWSRNDRLKYLVVVPDIQNMDPDGLDDRLVRDVLSADDVAWTQAWPEDDVRRLALAYHMWTQGDPDANMPAKVEGLFDTELDRSPSRFPVMSVYPPCWRRVIRVSHIKQAIETVGLPAPWRADADWDADETDLRALAMALRWCRDGEEEGRPSPEDMERLDAYRQRYAPETEPPPIDPPPGGASRGDVPPDAYRTSLSDEELAVLRKVRSVRDDADASSTEVIDVFSSYLKQFPNSPFRAEICAEIGFHYTTKRRHVKDRNLQQAISYLQEAHRHYQMKFSYHHNAVWGSLVNYNASGTIQNRMEYFRWLRDLHNHGSFENVHPVRPLDWVLDRCEPVLLTKDERRDIIEWFRDVNAKRSLEAARSNIVFASRGRPLDLRMLIDAFPDDPIAAMSRECLAVSAPGSMASSGSADASEPVERDPETVTPLDLKAEDRFTDTDRSTKRMEGQDQTSEIIQTAEPSGYGWIWVLVAGAVITAVSLALLARSRRS